MNRKQLVTLLVLVVLLGFGMNLQKVVEAGRTGFVFTVVTIVGTLLLGFLLGRAMNISRTTSHLISSGTAICGGSAIAAVGPVINATDEEMSVALGTVFILNSIALFAFPILATRACAWAALPLASIASAASKCLIASACLA